MISTLSSPVLMLQTATIFQLPIAVKISHWTRDQEGHTGLAVGMTVDSPSLCFAFSFLLMFQASSNADDHFLGLL